MAVVLPPSFYTRDDVISISRELLGKYLVTQIDGVRTSGMIVETEAYNGATDKACHAHLNRRTNRTEIMFHEGGVAYVYLCYGIHHLFNIITNVKDRPDAVLIRAVQPEEGLEEMLLRRGMSTLKSNLTAGPGSMSKALGITTSHYGQHLTEKGPIWVEDKGVSVPDSKIIASPRVGIDYAEEDALLPWRFRIKGNKWTSKAK
ncbi:DNA-3-methyladenine glycosylase [Roseivirga sp. BDSF3-8]|uniref:DNA-3-methyladenine glycosylase n=1 Tax=Roseivirga sp. BDSF3-8 TaxID=3241598 RepID=UPI00353274B0